MDPQDQPLVDAIAELKMIRALQMRVNTRTQRYARLLDDPEHPVGQATNDDLLQSLVRLAEREAQDPPDHPRHRAGQEQVTFGDRR